MTRLATHHLAAGGLSQAQIAATLNQGPGFDPVSERSVRRILSEEPPTEAALAAQQNPSGPGRPSTTEPMRQHVATELEIHPHLQTRELLARARDCWGYTGGKTAFYNLVRDVRKAVVARRPEPVVRFEGLPGEYAQFDFGERRQRFRNGHSRKVIAFVGRLKYSRHVHVEIVPDMTAESLVRAVVGCLEAWGRVPLIWVFDNPKTVRISKSGEPVKLHPYLAGLAAECRAAVLLCTPHQPQQKGSVENGVKWFKASFLAQREFADEADLQAQLVGWLQTVNQDRPSDATGETPAVRLQREQERLGSERTLPFTSSDYALRIPATVGPTAMVHIHGTSYSVDPKKVGAPAVIHLGARTLRVVIGGQSWTHERRDHCDTPQRLPRHRTEMLGAIYGERKHNTFKRQCLFELGPGSREFLEALIHRLGPQSTGWYRPVHQLFTLLEEHGNNAMETALGVCAARGALTVREVVHQLGRLPRVESARGEAPS